MFISLSGKLMNLVLYTVCVLYTFMFCPRPWRQHETFAVTILHVIVKIKLKTEELKTRHLTFLKDFVVRFLRIFGELGIWLVCTGRSSITCINFSQFNALRNSWLNSWITLLLLTPTVYVYLDRAECEATEISRGELRSAIHESTKIIEKIWKKAVISARNDIVLSIMQSLSVMSIYINHKIAPDKLVEK